MRGDQSFHIVDLAIGGMAAVIRNSIPAREALFAIAERDGKRLGPRGASGRLRGGRDLGDALVMLAASGSKQ
jgi:hypothetical protein